MRETICLFIVLILILPIQGSYATSMVNQDFRIETDTSSDLNRGVNIEGIKKLSASPQYTLSYPYSDNDKPSSISIYVSTSIIDFGQISPGEPYNRTSRLGINNIGGKGVVVFASSEHVLRSGDGNEIPDTTCDNGACSEVVASEWFSPLTYGFGYSCKNLTGLACSPDFINQGYFKQFSDKEKSEKLGLILFSHQDEIQSEIIYKLNISKNQERDNYSTDATLVAAPVL